MSQKRINRTIANLLAEQVYDKLKVVAKTVVAKTTELIEKDRLYKKIEAVSAKMQQLTKERDELTESLSKKYSNSTKLVHVSTYGNRTINIRVAPADKLTVSSISDRILLEDYFKGGSLTSDQLIQQLVDEYKKELS